jgi:hypothetical protein
MEIALLRIMNRSSPAIEMLNLASTIGHRVVLHGCFAFSRHEDSSLHDDHWRPDWERSWITEIGGKHSEQSNEYSQLTIRVIESLIVKLAVIMDLSYLLVERREQSSIAIEGFYQASGWGFGLYLGPCRFASGCCLCWGCSNAFQLRHMIIKRQASQSMKKRNRRKF